MTTCRALVTCPYFPRTSTPNSKKSSNIHAANSRSTFRVLCSTSTPELPTTTTEKVGNDIPLTGSAYDFYRATKSLTQKALSSPKKVTLVRHGYSTWNEESRVQGSSNLSVLTEKGVMQAQRCRKAIEEIHFDQCFASPISRAKSTAEIIWQGREQPLVFLDSLKEAHLYFLEGMKNVDAKRVYPKEFTTWREDPANFCVDGVYPLEKLWERAREAWKEILLSPGDHFLVVTHKSILRALICTALGLGPERFADMPHPSRLMYTCLLSRSDFEFLVFFVSRFRSIDVNNGGLSVFSINKQGEAMLKSLNMTAHMYTDHIYHY